jgi:uncharacterized phage infection (PIP) family protein YhgE
MKDLLSLREILEARINGMDTAIKLTQQYPTLLDTAMVSLKNLVSDSISTLRDIHNQRFDKIDTQIAERDTVAERTSRDNKVAVDAAFAAAKEAVGEQNKSNALAIAKSEAAFTKQIDQIGELLKAIEKATSDKIDDLKDRLTMLESTGRGARDVTDTSRQQHNWVINLWAVMGMAALAILVSIVALFKHT